MTKREQFKSSAEQEREAFEKVYGHLDLSQKLNVWNVSVYSQTHVQALWQGWIDRAALSADKGPEYREAGVWEPDGSKFTTYRNENLNGKAMYVRESK